MPLSSGLSSSFALSCGLLVMAPNSAQVVSLSAFTVRSGSALPSLHQNSHPMSQGDVLRIKVHSIENDARCFHHIVAHAVAGHPRNFVFSHRRRTLAVSVATASYGQRIQHRGHLAAKPQETQASSLTGRSSFELGDLEQAGMLASLDRQDACVTTRGDVTLQAFQRRLQRTNSWAAGLSGGKGKEFSVNCESGFCVVDRDFRSNRRRRMISQRIA